MAETKAVAVVAQEITDNVTARINELVGSKSIRLPDGYDAATAIRSASLILQDATDKNKNPVLSVCTKASVCNSLLDMCIQGLHPAKKQCYFIAYGNQMSLFRSYFGTVSALKLAQPSVYKVVADLVREGDEVEFGQTPFGERFVKRIVTNPLENIRKPIAYGFCNIYNKAGEILGYSIMTWEEIQKSWKQSKNYGREDSVHAKFPEEMAKRTLINRACKRLLNESTDRESSVFYEAFNRTTDNEFAGDRIEEQIAQPVEKKTMAEQFKSEYKIGANQSENVAKKVEAEIYPQPEDEEYENLKEMESELFD